MVGYLAVPSFISVIVFIYIFIYFYISVHRLLIFAIIIIISSSSSVIIIIIIIIIISVTDWVLYKLDILAGVTWLVVFLFLPLGLSKENF